MLKDKRLLTMILGSLFLWGVLSSSPVFAQDNSAVTERVSGNTRYETSTAISKSGWTNATTIIIVSGVDYPDALSASALSKANNAPIILTDKNAIGPTTLAEITRLKATKALIIGGTGVIATGVENQLKSLKIATTRIGGSDRYDTSKKVAEIIGVTKGIILAANLDFPDPLSIAPIAAMKGIPILLTPKNSLNSNIGTFLKGKSIPVSYLVGGTGVLATSVYYSVPNSKRLSGADRYATNLSINNEFEEEFAGELNSIGTIYLASGNNFPDALSGSALAAKNNAPIFLTDKDSISNATISFIKSKNVKHVVILGGNGSISKNVEDIIKSAINNTPVNTTVNTTSVSLNKSSDALKVGDTDSLLVTVSPVNASNKSVNWASSNNDVASVDNTGKVTAISAGTALITVTTADVSKTSTCSVTVAIVPVVNTISVTLNKNTDALQVGGTDTLLATVAPESATNKTVRWTTSNKDIAIVDDSGKVTAISNGTTTITATTDDENINETCTVTVAIIPVVNVTGVEFISIDTDEVSVGGSYNLVAAVAPYNATNKAVNWTSSNTSAAKVDNTGKVTGVMEGASVITATTLDGSYTATWNVTISAATTIITNPVNTTPASTVPKIFAIDIGHNSIHDTGAVGIKKEDVLNKEVGTRVIAQLTKLGYTAINCAPTNATSTTDSLKQRSDIANAANADYYVAIHFNSYTDPAVSGTMIYSNSTKFTSKANNILSNMTALGYNNKGLEDNSRCLYVLSNTKMPAILMECAFVTSTSDMQRYNPDDIATAIVNGLISGN